MACSRACLLQKMTHHASQCKPCMIAWRQVAPRASLNKSQEVGSPEQSWAQWMRMSLARGHLRGLEGSETQNSCTKLVSRSRPLPQRRLARQPGLGRRICIAPPRSLTKSITVGAGPTQLSLLDPAEKRGSCQPFHHFVLVCPKNRRIFSSLFLCCATHASTDLFLITSDLLIFACTGLPAIPAPAQLLSAASKLVTRQAAASSDPMPAAGSTCTLHECANETPYRNSKHSGR